MSKEQSQIQRVDVDALSIPIGSRVVIEPEGLGEKVKTRFIGMERKSYFIVSLAPVVGEDKLAYDYLYKGNPTKIFYTQEGIINGFMSRVILYTTSPFKHLYLEYPTDAEICNLRQSQRTDCHLPSKLTLNGFELPGMICNISATGCGVSVRAQKPKLPKLTELPELENKLQPGAQLQLRFYLTQNIRECNVTCELKNKRKAKNMLLLGMSFADLDQNTQKRVSEFIDWVSSYRA